jgi:carboxylate-amine ligase
MNARDDDLHAAAPPGVARGLRAFSAHGIELEYAVVRRDSLDIDSAAPPILRALAGVPDTAPAPQKVSVGELAWSNELVAHVLEVKNESPGALEGLGRRFHAEVLAMNRRIEPLGLRLMPGGMHPWMHPRQGELWSFGGSAIYRAYDRIFGCSGHGWANLQSMHLNLPFQGDAEFERLHAAARLVVPILPALAASSPYVEGEAAPNLDHRMEVYRGNAAAVPLVRGLVVPDTFSSRGQYERELLAPMYRAIAAHDPEGELQNEWLNGRGVIARFDRSALEVRVMDTQECPQMDAGLAALASDAIRWLYEGHAGALAAQQALSTERLSAIFLECVRDAERASIRDRDYLALLGVDRPECRAAELWQRLSEDMDARGTPHRAVWGSGLTFILSRGTLARRLIKAAGASPRIDTLREVYRALSDCLEQGRPFDP